MPQHREIVSKSYRCGHCSKKLTSRASLKSHEGKCYQQRRYGCPNKVCRYSSSRKSNLERHLLTCNQPNRQPREDTGQNKVAEDTPAPRPNVSEMANKCSVPEVQFLPAAPSGSESESPSGPSSAADNPGPAPSQDDQILHAVSEQTTDWPTEVHAETWDDLLAILDDSAGPTTSCLETPPETTDAPANAVPKPMAPSKVTTPWKLIPLDPPEVPLPDPRLLTWPSPSSDCCCRASRQLYKVRARAKADRDTRVIKTRRNQPLPSGVQYSEVTEEAQLTDGTYYQITYRGYQLPSVPGLFQQQ